MILLLPMNSNDPENAELTSVVGASFWATVDIQEGRVSKLSFAPSRDEIEDFSDAVIVNNNYEPVMDFLEQQMIVLVAHQQKTIEEIVEAYLFRELHDLAL